MLSISPANLPAPAAKAFPCFCCICSCSVLSSVFNLFITVFIAPIWPQKPVSSPRSALALSSSSTHFCCRDIMSRQQKWVEEELKARAERGEDTGFWGQMGAMKTVMNKLKTELKTEQEQMQQKHGNAFAAGAGKFAGEIDSM